jgi:peptidyl-prolyl cis-trans isomerase SurA
MIIKKIFLVLLLVLSGSFLYSQSQVKEGETVDKILAIVGNEIIMQSDLNGQLMALSQQNPNLNINDRELRQQILNAMINEKLVIMKAIEDSITASDEEIQSQWEFYLNRVIQYYGSAKRVEDIYGMSIARMESEYREEIRKQILSQKVKQLKFSDIKVTQREVQDFFDQFKDSIKVIPAQVELYHLVKNVESDDNIKENLIKLANSVRDSILNGGNFADFAKRYSNDPGTAIIGGEMGWFPRGKLFPEFEKAAFALQKGELSKVIETPLGFHIIQTIDKTKDSINVRHILFKTGITSDDIEIAKKILSELRERVLKGENFEELAKKYSDDKETKSLGGFLGKFPLNDLPAAYKEFIDKIPDGSVTEPLAFSSKPKQSYHIIYRKRTIPEHPPKLPEDYKEIEQMASVYKQNKLYAEWIESLRKTMYWEIKN